MGIYEFMVTAPFLTFFLVLIFTMLFSELWSCLLKNINILVHGWMPEHCNADGEFKRDEHTEDK